MMYKIKSFLLVFLAIPLFLVSCGGWNPTSVQDRPVDVDERVKQNIEEGKGVSIGGLIGGRGGNFEFSSSNPMWRASLEILDFLPMTTVDYSGGMIITDWYTDANTTDESLKFTIRFLSNEIRSDSLKIIIHKKKCSNRDNCSVTLVKNSKISNELRSTILNKAAILEKESKNKKKN